MRARGIAGVVLGFGLLVVFATQSWAKPDLVVTSVPISYYQRGIFFAWAAGIANIGTEPTPAGVVIRVDWTGGFHLWNVEFTGPLNPGESIGLAPKEGQGSAPYGHPGPVILANPSSGPFNITVTVDEGDLIDESNEENNSKTITSQYSGSRSGVAGMGRYDLSVLRILTDPAIPQAGDMVRFGAEIRSSHDTPTPASTIHGVLFSINGTPVSWSDDFTGPLNVGESRVLWANSGPSGTALWSAEERFHVLEAWVDDQNRLPGEYDEDANNRRAIVLKVEPPIGNPDLVVTDVWLVKRDKGPFRYNFEATIRNDGAASTPAGVILGVSFFANDQPVAWHDLNTDPLAPGESRVLNSNSGPQGEPWYDFGGPGTWRITAHVDDVNRIAESNDDNNRHEVSFSIAPPADPPRITTQPRSQTVAEGSPASFSVAAAGAEPLSFQWRKDGSDISGATNPTLSIGSVAPEHAGSYTCVVRNEAGSATSESAVLTVQSHAVAPPSITSHPQSQTVGVGSTVTFSVSASGTEPLTFQWRKNGSDIPGANSSSFRIEPVIPPDQGNYSCVVSNAAGAATSNSAELAINVDTPAPQITSHPSPQVVTAGGTAQFTLQVGSEGVQFQWERNGQPIRGATGPSLTVQNVQPSDVGLYSVLVRNASSETRSEPVLLGIASNERLIGPGFSPEIFQNIRHRNQNIYDQVLLTGTAATITADPGQITRMSFIDLNDDIVQVEFSGSGSLTLILENVSGPALPAKYHQDIQYMKGHPSVFMTGAAADTNVSLFSVGRANAVNQDLFRDGENYDGHAGAGVLAISSPSQSMGGILMGNTVFFNVAGLIGIHAPGVNVRGPVYTGDISAAEAARPVLNFGSVENADGGVRITGGDLRQQNGAPVRLEGAENVLMRDGTDSHGRFEPAQPNNGRLVPDS